MDWYHILALVAFVACCGMFLGHFIHLIRLGMPKDKAKAQGKTAAGIRYAYINSMMPQHKESAYLHLPTYTAGIIYHLGTFLSLLLLLYSLINIYIGWAMPEVFRWIIGACLLISTLFGLGVLIKRLVKQELRSFSNPDDYISNGLTTLFQAITALFITFPHIPAIEMVYFILAVLFLVWFPLGKTRHILYFFFARLHLGYFYGRRGTWPEKSKL
ncbi:MAG TPA: hypothetical protein PK979_01990 [Bacteroidales bacterium]|nr:hypothetical protein [Bacteroidales bacterium]